MRLPAVLIALAGPAAAAAELVMVEEAGCIYCARWNAEIAPAYPKTEEGRAAPLRRIDLNGPVPDDLSLDGPLRITPTFVLVDEGREVARIEGYPGDEFFWPLLGQMLRQLPGKDTQE
jgi:thioredoxin-related protein